MENNNESLIHFAKFGDVTVGTIDNTSMLDGTTVVTFGNQVLAYVEANPKSYLLLNFENVQYLSSAALTELIRINDAVKASGGSMRVCNLSDDIEKVFTITNFDKLFDINRDGLKSSVGRFQRVIDVKHEEEEWGNRP